MTLSPEGPLIDQPVITLAMTEAGARVLQDVLNTAPCTAQFAAKEVFRQMVQAFQVEMNNAAEGAPL